MHHFFLLFFASFFIFLSLPIFVDFHSFIHTNPYTYVMTCEFGMESRCGYHIDYAIKIVIYLQCMWRHSFVCCVLDGLRQTYTQHSYVLVDHSTYTHLYLGSEQYTLSKTFDRRSETNE